MFLVEDRSERAVLDALKSGRMYAVQRARETELVLAGFAARAGAASATSGETLRVAAATPVEVSVDVETTGAPARDVRVTLVKQRRGRLRVDRPGAHPSSASRRLRRRSHVLPARRPRPRTPAEQPDLREA